MSHMGHGRRAHHSSKSQERVSLEHVGMDLVGLELLFRVQQSPIPHRLLGWAAMETCDATLTRDRRSSETSDGLHCLGLRHET